MTLQRLCTVLALPLLAGALCGGAAAAQTLPPGTTIPIEIQHALGTKALQAGDPISGKTTQRVEIAGQDPIPAGTGVLGRVVEVRRQTAPGDGSALVVQFDRLQLRQGSAPLRAGVRAMASFQKTIGIRSAFMSNDEPQVSVYRQIGGDYYYPDSAVYSGAGAAVGQDTRNGIFVKLAGAQATDPRDQMVCDAVDHPQAVGPFSSAACGLYGFQDLVVRQAPVASAPVAIQFQSDSHAVAIAAHTTLLLQVVQDN